MNPLVMMQQPEPEPEKETISKDLLDKYETVILAFRNDIAGLVRGHDPERWDEESECIQLLMHLDSRFSFALEWIDERRHKPSSVAPPSHDKPATTVDAGQYL